MIPRKKYDDDWREHWELTKKMTNEAKVSQDTIERGTIIALLTDIHTMLESMTVEPEVE